MVQIVKNIISMIKKIHKKRTVDEFNIPEKSLEIIAESLKEQAEKEQRKNKYASTKQVLKLLAGGLFLGASIFAPGLTIGLKMFINNENEYGGTKEWKKFNTSYLSRAIKRLEKQKLVEIYREGDLDIIKTTTKGKKQVLKYALDKIEIKKPKIWNGRWYFVSYDVPKNKDWLRKIMRDFLKRLGFYQFQESLYIHAYPCESEINFIKEYLEISEYVKILVVSKIENDEVFREYFMV